MSLSTLAETNPDGVVVKSRSSAQVRYHEQSRCFRDSDTKRHRSQASHRVAHARAAVDQETEAEMVSRHEPYSAERQDAGPAVPWQNPGVTFVKRSNEPDGGTTSAIAGFISAQFYHSVRLCRSHIFISIVYTEIYIPCGVCHRCANRYFPKSSSSHQHTGVTRSGPSGGTVQAPRVSFEFRLSRFVPSSRNVR